MNRVIAGLCLALLCTASNSAFADDDENSVDVAKRKEAEDSFKRGVAAFKEGRFEAAKAEFLSANEISPHPQLLFNLAITQERLGERLNAASSLEKVVDDAGMDSKIGRRASDRLDAIASKLAKIDLTIEDRDAEIEVDGDIKRRRSFFVEPGSHVLVVRANDVESTWRLNLSAGEERVIDWEPGTQDRKLQIKSQERVSKRKSDDTNDDSDNFDINAKSAWGWGVTLGGVVNARLIDDSAAPLLGLSVNNKTVHLGLDVISAAEFKDYIVRPSLRIAFMPRIEGELSGAYSFGGERETANGATVKAPSFFAGAVGLRVNAPLTEQLRVELAAQASFATKEIGFTIPIFFGLRYSQ